MPPPASYAPLRRPLDYLYLTFFLLHLLASLLIDGQHFYPSSLTPAFLTRIKDDYIRDSGDPLMGGLARGDPAAAWFEAALALEMGLQVPVFLLGSVGLWYDWPQIPALLLPYTTLASSSTLFCLVQALRGPGAAQLTSANRAALWQAYLPFCLLPALMGLDMFWRVWEALGRTRIQRGKVE